MLAVPVPSGNQPRAEQQQTAGAAAAVPAGWASSTGTVAAGELREQQVRQCKLMHQLLLLTASAYLYAP